MTNATMVKRQTNRSPEESAVSLFVDGPNMLRKEFMIDLRELKERVAKHGRVVVAKVFINQFAPEKLIEAIINEGYKVEMILAVETDDANDVDVSVAVAATEAAIAHDVDYIAIASRDADFLPVIQKAKEYGKKVILVGAEPGFSASLRNAADICEVM
jgi:uncharacterized protein (TIGR00288 family)